MTHTCRVTCEFRQDLSWELNSEVAEEHKYGCVNWELHPGLSENSVVSLEVSLDRFGVDHTDSTETSTYIKNDTACGPYQVYTELF